MSVGGRGGWWDGGYCRALFGMAVGWSVGLLSLDWLLGWLVGQLSGLMVGWLVGRSVGWLVDWLISHRIGPVQCKVIQMFRILEPNYTVRFINQAVGNTAFELTSLQ